MNQVEQIANIDHHHFNALLADEVVMEWLMKLEDEHAEDERPAGTRDNVRGLND